MAKFKIYDSEIEYRTDHRNVKYPRLEFKTGKLLLVLPKNYKKEIELIEKHKKWIYKKNLIINLAKKEAVKKKIRAKDEEELKNFVINLAKKFSEKMGVEINKIYFKKLKSKWGSCSPRKNLTFNTLMKYLPESLIKYVVFHEVAHLKEKNHNDRFWSWITKKFRDYPKKEKELLVYWFLVQDILIGRV